MNLSFVVANVTALGFLFVPKLDTSARSNDKVLKAPEIYVNIVYLFFIF